MAATSAKGKAPANGTSAAYELPWSVCLHTQNEQSTCLPTGRVEKYRPKTLDDVVGNAETIERLKVISRDGNCPHIIISVHFRSLLREPDVVTSRR